jgi:hypothetical protein
MFVQQRLYNLQQQGSLERLPNQIQPPNADHGHHLTIFTIIVSRAIA